MAIDWGANVSPRRFRSDLREPPCARTAHPIEGLSAEASRARNCSYERQGFLRIDFASPAQHPNPQRLHSERDPFSDVRPRLDDVDAGLAVSEQLDDGAGHGMVFGRREKLELSVRAPPGIICDLDLRTDRARFGGLEKDSLERTLVAPFRRAAVRGRPAGTPPDCYFSEPGSGGGECAGGSDWRRERDSNFGSHLDLDRRSSVVAGP